MRLPQLLLPMSTDFSIPEVSAARAETGVRCTQMVALASLPLSCIDHPQPQSDHPQTYLWVYDDKAHPEGYNRNRAFYGCYDWHSAVNSTWTLLALLRKDPKMFLAPVIRQRLTEHLGKDNIAGEINFFSYDQPGDAESKEFERPYGYTWLLKLYGELKSWNDPDAQKLAVNMQPLVKLLAAKYIDYLQSLPYPMRVGVHPNTALTMSFALDYTDATGDMRSRPPSTMRRFGFLETTRTAQRPTSPAMETSLLPAWQRPCLWAGFSIRRASLPGWTSFSRRSILQRSRSINQRSTHLVSRRLGVMRMLRIRMGFLDQSHT